MKRAIIITTLVFIWPMGAIAFDFGSILESGADLYKKGTKMMDKDSSSSSKQALHYKIHYPVYPGVKKMDKKQCNLLLTKDSVDEVVGQLQNLL